MQQILELTLDFFLPIYKSQMATWYLWQEKEGFLKSNEK